MTSIDQVVADALAAAHAGKRAPAQPEVCIVAPAKDSPLETLLCLYQMRKDAYDAAEGAWNEYKSALTNALRAYNSDENIKTYEVPATRMYPALTVAWRAGREYLPTELIKQHIPQVWSAFKETTKGYWEIRRKGKR